MPRLSVIGALPPELPPVWWVQNPSSLLVCIKKLASKFLERAMAFRAHAGMCSQKQALEATVPMNMLNALSGVMGFFVSRRVDWSFERAR